MKFMRLSKIFLVAFIGATCFFASSQSADAKINRDRIALGGITYRCPISKALEIYGDPDMIDENGKYIWGDTFIVATLKGGRAEGITTTDDNGITTPDGVHVGMSEDVLDAVYGRPDFDNGTTLTYLGYQGGGALMFRIKDGTIYEIHVGTYS